ncbi:hypothetical protein [Chitinophaga solisilvae]|uniref:hypothetical protein n=1 Tax=Chitinophaga solisilvae TaxID=1233460 RepID=UPI00136DD6A7|nr:hypothetical protein [Chitinophaga solisilvae]
MFELKSKISIGKYTSIKPVEVKVTRSIFDFVDKAVVKLPAVAYEVKGKSVSKDKQETARLFHEEDMVSISLGYNDKLKEEFVGFVTRVNDLPTVELECEGYSYQLRKKTFNEKMKVKSLKDILNIITTGTDIKLAKDLPDVKIDKYVAESKNGTEILLALKEAYLIDFFFTGAVLNANLRQPHEGGTVKYQMGWNVIESDALKLRTTDKTNVTVTASCPQKNGKSLTSKTGSQKKDSQKVEVKVNNISDPKTLKEIAEKKYDQLSYDGYEGKITCFLQPFCIPGFKAEIRDKKSPKKDGRYYVQATEVNYSSKGARRIVTIGAKMK